MSFDLLPPNTTLTHLKEHPLDGAIARLDRADQNIIDLQVDIREFWDRKPQVFKTNINPETGDFIHAARSVKNPGLWVQVRAGEILFLLRSSLDHVIAKRLIPRVAADQQKEVLEHCSFPIAVKGDWKSFDWSKIPGATPELKAALAECQPCNRTDGLPIADHPLAVLNTMHNIDKHRLLLVTVIKPTTIIERGPGFITASIVTDVSGEYIPGSSNVVGQVDAPLITGRLDLSRRRDGRGFP